MAARSMWKGAITFGMVSVPVKLYLATESTSKVSFNMLCKECHGRTGQAVTCATHGNITRADTVKGYEWSSGQYVVVTEEELEKIALPSNKALDITGFCPTTDDVGFIKQSYYVAPEAVGAKAFDLLRTAMLEQGVRAIAKVALRDRESLCVIEPRGPGMLMSTLYWPDEIRSQEEVTTPAKVAPTQVEVEMGKQLIDALTAPFDPSLYTDQYRDAVLALIESKADGLTALIQPAPQPAPQPEATDLMAVLRASLEANLEASRAKKADARKGKVKVSVA